MPEIVYNRLWCKTCGDWELFDRKFLHKDAEPFCKKCNSTYEPVTYGEIPTEKLKEQRLRWKANKRNTIHSILNYGMSGFKNDALLPSGSNVRIIESDAGQKAIDEYVANKAQAERERRKQEIAKYAGTQRNEVCPCGTGKKFKNCHLKIIQSYG